ncbi:hypothetical protein, variant 1 [Capsaspora owczarzaki ATCC 30864]|uniref:Uncharacterized protein n=1 Tax=Capsaspora owczarzaki (strain ATCC 30864) TaxID=595528 RepID=A0A0D2WRG9_CAPO3|nr:hypothetical protein, variant 1 [Capsaspora owczarzaki ATCC 30864]
MTLASGNDMNDMSQTHADHADIAPMDDDGSPSLSQWEHEDEEAVENSRQNHHASAPFAAAAATASAYLGNQTHTWSGLVSDGSRARSDPAIATAASVHPYAAAADFGDMSLSPLLPSSPLIPSSIGNLEMYASMDALEPMMSGSALILADPSNDADMQFNDHEHLLFAQSPSRNAQDSHLQEATESSVAFRQALSFSPSTILDTSAALAAANHVQSSTSRAVATSANTQIPKGPRARKVCYVDELGSIYHQKYTKYFPKQIAELQRQFPAQALPHVEPTIKEVSMASPLILQHTFAQSDSGCIYSSSLSLDGQLLATASTLGSICLWDANTLEQVGEIRERADTFIMDYYAVHILPNPRFVAAGGKCKDRRRWSANDNDNHILPCAVRVFDTVTCEVVAMLAGHVEEVLSVTSVTFKGANFIVSTSEDGHIWRYPMADDWSALVGTPWRMRDDFTCMAFGVVFIPNTANKFMLAACDDTVRLYDFEDGTLLQSFGSLYSSYCDCIINAPCEDILQAAHNEFFFITRGCEVLDLESHSVASRPNKCILHRLTLPENASSGFRFQPVQEFSHSEYQANSWLMHISTNGRFLAAPTVTGRVFLWSLLGGGPACILADHSDREVRQTLFHPTKPELFTCGDDGMVKVYSSVPPASLSTRGAKAK